jgi:hypothetical protein
MREKLPRYFLLSLISFCFFTGVFHAIAHAQGISGQPDLQKPLETVPTQFLPPTPTIYHQPTIEKATANEPVIPSPTPTIFVKPPQTLPTVTQSPTPTPTTDEETPAVSVQPTVTPTPTDIPSLTPTTTPIPTEVAQPSSSDLETFFSQYSTQYNVSEDELKKIANCESGFNTNSDTGLYAGMFQFSAVTWESERNAMGMDPNPDLRKDPGEAIKTTAYMLSRGGQNAWPNCH